MESNRTEIKDIEFINGFLDSIPDAMIVSDRNGMIIRANTDTEKLFGYSKEELIGQPVEFLVPDGFREKHRHLLEEYSSTHQVRPMMSGLELSGCRKDGTLFTAEISFRLVQVDQEPLIISTIRDITDRIRASEELEKNHIIQSTVYSILRNSLEPISLKEILERTLDRLLAVSWIALQSKGSVYLLDRDNPKLLDLIAERGFTDDRKGSCARIPVGKCLCGLAVTTRKIVFSNRFDDKHEIIHPGMTPHGHYCVPILSDGEVLGVLNLYVNAGHERKLAEDRFLISVADVLAGVIRCKRAEEDCHKNEERFDLAVRGTDAGIWDWNLRTNEVYFSPRWKSMLGYEENEISYDYHEWESRLHPNDRDRALATLSNYLEGRIKEYGLEHRLRHKDGSYRWILARGAAIHDTDDKPYRMVGSHIDITDQKTVELQLRQKEAQLMAAQRIQANFLPSEPPAIPGFEVAGKTYPADFAAGDLFDYISMPGGHVGFVIGDVTGHGIGPALVMASTHAYLHSFAEVHSDANEILARTNTALIKETDPGLFVSVFFGRLDPESRTFVYSSAGHTPGYILDAGGAVKASLERTATPLAVLNEFEITASEPIVLDPGDIVVLLTDGVIEARSPEGEFFGTERTLEIVRDNKDRPAHEILEALNDAVRKFSCWEGQVDDITIVILKHAVLEEHNLDSHSPAR